MKTFGVNAVNNNDLVKLNEFYEENKNDYLKIIVNELNDYTNDWVKNHDKTNIFYALCGSLNYALKEASYETIWWHSKIINKFYKNSFILNNINNSICKNYFFDALCGITSSWDYENKTSVIRENRKFVIDFVNKNNLNKKIFLTYMQDNQKFLNLKPKEEFLTEPEVEFLKDKKYFVSWDEVLYFGKLINLCNIVPISIYNQCAYSIVMETNYSNEYNFFTEKTAKPIFGKRLFIVFNGQYFLKNLRRLGFKTFDGIIDESYDLISDNYERWKLASEQVLLLLKVDQSKIQNEIKEITDYNYNHMINFCEK